MSSKTSQLVQEKNECSSKFVSLVSLLLINFSSLKENASPKDRLLVPFLLEILRDIDMANKYVVDYNIVDILWLLIPLKLCMRLMAAIPENRKSMQCSLRYL